MKFIATQTLVSSAASVTFTGIPSGYTDLVVTFSARSDYAGIVSQSLLTFNSDTGANYTSKWVYINSGVTNSGGIGSTSIPLQFGIVGATQQVGLFSNGTIVVPAYSGSTAKTGQADFSSAAGYPVLQTFAWTGTAAITSFTMTANGNNFVAGTTISVFGYNHA